MDYILCFVIVCLAVFTAGQSADLSISVSYTSIEGGLVRYQLFHGDTRGVKISTNDISLVCNSGVFSLTEAAYDNNPFYHRVNESTFLIRTVFVNIRGFTNALVCANGSSNITAGLDFSGVGLVQSLPQSDVVGLSPGSAVQVTSGTNSGFIACISSSGDLVNNNNFPNLYRPNGTRFDLFPGLQAAGGVTHTFAISSTAGLQLRLRDFMDEGEYRCATLDAENTPINITFVLFIDATDPCTLASCPEYSLCNKTAANNLCQCQFQFLEYANSLCQCPQGYSLTGTNSLNGTNTSISCEDIDECLALPSPCSHLGHNVTCTNTNGSYTCACQSNHTVVNGLCVHSCDALNCSQGSNRMCQWNGNQSFSCECLFGYLPTANSSACSLTTVPTSTMEPTVYSSSSIPPVYSSSSIPPVYSSTLISTMVTTSDSSTTMGPESNADMLQGQIEDKLSQNLTSLTAEETDELLSLLASSLADSSAMAANYATAASLVSQVTQLMDNITEEQLGELIDILSSVADIAVLTDIQNNLGGVDVEMGVGDVVSDIISAVENIAQLLAPLFYSKQNETVFENDNIRLEVESLSLDKGTLVFGENSTAEFSLRALLSSSFRCRDGQNCTGNITDCQTVGVSIQIKNVNSFVRANVSNVTVVFESWFCADVQEEVLYNSGIVLTANTDLFSFSLASVLCEISTANLSVPIILNFRIQDPSLTRPTCVSLDPGPGAVTPDTSTCSRVPSPSADTVSCSCSHLTSFSILMSPDTRYQNSAAMEIVSYVGLSVSILSLVLGLMIFTFIRFKVSFAIFFVHYNLMLTVLLSEIVFIVGIDRSEIPVLCLIIAVALHYILLVSFCWMFFEIFNLLILIFRPRVSQKKIIHLYWPLAYGLPLIAVGITAGFSRCNYGNYRGVSYPAPMSTNCWLPRREGNYWAFIGPALFIILINSLMLAVLIIKLIHIKWAGMSYRASSLRKSTSHTLAEGFVSAIRATVLLLPIMGFTWIFGVFAINSGETMTVVFQWLFLLFNSLQGFFIFLFYCVLKTEVRDAVLLLVLRKVFRREIRLAEGQSLFSTYGISRKQSATTERNTMDRSLTASESPFKICKEDLTLVPVSPATQYVGVRTRAAEMAFANPGTQATKEL